MDQAMCSPPSSGSPSLPCPPSFRGVAGRTSPLPRTSQQLRVGQMWGASPMCAIFRVLRRAVRAPEALPIARRRTRLHTSRASSALHCPVLGLPHGGRARRPDGPQTWGDDLDLRPPDGGLVVGDRGPRRTRDRRPGARLGGRRSLRTRGDLVSRPARDRGWGVCGRRRVPSGAAPVRGHLAPAWAKFGERPF